MDTESGENVNTNSVPSDDSPLVNKAIQGLENGLDPIHLQTQTFSQHATDTMDQLEKPRKSMSPFATVPFDVLSEIFILCSRKERLSPMVVASVSRQWRETILNTPMAWSRLFPQNGQDYILPPLYISMFLKRSDPCLLHVRVPWTTYDCECEGIHQLTVRDCDCGNVRALLMTSDRLRCLSIRHDWTNELSKRDYPNLERLAFLRFREEDEFRLPEAFLDMSRFGNLRILELGRRWQLNSMVRLASVGNPRLRFLHISVDRNETWVDLIRAFSDTLESLWVSGDYGNCSTKCWIFHCPKLENLFVEEGKLPGTASSRTLKFFSPHLTTLRYYSNDEIIRVSPEGGIGGVIHLITNTAIPLLGYDQLRILQLDFSKKHLSRILEQLERNLHLCPLLQFIELRDSVGGDFELFMQERLANRNCAASSNIKLIFVSTWIHQTRQFNYMCNDDMACRTQYDCTSVEKKKYRF